MKLETSCLMKRKSSLPARWAMLSTLPVTKLSIATTWWPSWSRRSQRCEPTNPAPPVTTILNGSSSFLGQAHGPARHLRRPIHGRGLAVACDRLGGPIARIHDPQVATIHNRQLLYGGRPNRGRQVLLREAGLARCREELAQVAAIPVHRRQPVAAGLALQG